MGTEAADLQRLNRDLLVVDGARRRGEVQHEIQRFIDGDVLGDIVLDEAEIGVTLQVGDVLRAAGDEVIHPDDAHALGEQGVAEVRAEEAGSASDEGGFHQ